MDATPLETWAHHLAQRHLAHLAHLTSSSPPAAELPVLLHLAEQVPSAQLPLEVLLDLAVVCPPWPQDGAGADPVRALFDRRWAATTDADDRTASLAGLAEALVALGSSADSPVRLALVFALLRMGGEPAVSAVLALERELVQGLLEELARTYASAASTLSIRLVCLHALSLLLGASSGVASSAPLPPLAAVLPTLPAPSDELPKPFASLWSDGETLFGLSSRVIDAPGWGDVAMQLLQLEGDRKEWETEALRLEQTETLYPSTGVVSPVLIVSGSSRRWRLLTCLPCPSVRRCLPASPRRLLKPGLSPPTRPSSRPSSRSRSSCRTCPRPSSRAPSPTHTSRPHRPPARRRRRSRSASSRPYSTRRRFRKT